MASRGKAASADNASSLSAAAVTSPASTASARCFWPRDLLPHSIDNAKIFSYGYDADIERFMGAAGLNTVHQHGRNLLNSLSDLLDQDEVRIPEASLEMLINRRVPQSLPLIIVVHSLGGLVVKEVRFVTTL
jgi:hypothetical protein